MTKQLSRAATAAVASLAAAGCTTLRAVAPEHRPPAVAGAPVAAQNGTVTVPIAMPALPERAAQYVYSKNFINTVEVRLRDSYGTEQVQWVARNTYLAGSQASGNVTVTFFNVMQGQVVLTVRTSHLPLVSASGPVKYDGLRDIFFIDLNTNGTYETTDTEVRVLNGDKGNYFITFANDGISASSVLPDSMRTDTSTAPLGFGIGGATGLVDPAGGTTTLTAKVGTMAQWGQAAFGITREYTAGDTITLPVADGGVVQSGDQVALSNGNPASGLVDNLATTYIGRPTTTNVSAKTVSFTPTKTTSVNTSSLPSAWPAWLVRGRAVGEHLTSAQVPAITVWPATVSATGSIVVGQKDRVAASGTATVQYDLRDAYHNLVAGNITGQNSLSIGGAVRDNFGLAVDFTTYSSAYSADSTGLNPFMLPGRTAGRLNTTGTYTQGSTAAGPITTAATYSVSNTAWKLVQLEVPYFIWNANQGSFGAGGHAYTLGVVPDPVVATNFWVSLSRAGVTVASGSISNAATGNFALAIPTPSGSPLPQVPAIVAPVVVNKGSAIVIGDNGITFTVSDYGARKVGDTDTVRTRVLKGSTVLFSKDVNFTW
ncbi:MAG: hypothetical protein FJZ01_11320 [Candidatus Sericytochromatia bacterium]|nr:hypothetical protein [Candidatus Tanganyikabacteria bacterium]